MKEIIKFDFLERTERFPQEKINEICGKIGGETRFQEVECPYSVSIICIHSKIQSELTEKEKDLLESFFEFVLKGKYKKEDYDITITEEDIFQVEIKEAIRIAKKETSEKQESFILESVHALGEQGEKVCMFSTCFGERIAVGGEVYGLLFVKSSSELEEVEEHFHALYKKYNRIVCVCPNERALYTKGRMHILQIIQKRYGDLNAVEKPLTLYFTTKDKLKRNVYDTLELKKEDE